MEMEQQVSTERVGNELLDRLEKLGRELAMLRSQGGPLAEYLALTDLLVKAVRPKHPDFDRPADDVLELSVRTANCLRVAGALTVRQVLQLSETQLHRTPNFGRRSLNELTEALAKKGWHIGQLGS